MPHWTYDKPRPEREPPKWCLIGCPMWDGGRCVAAGLDVDNMIKCPEIEVHERKDEKK